MVQATVHETDALVRPSGVRVAVVDDHESVRLGLKAAFLDDGYDFVLAAATVDELLSGLTGREVDVVVLDLSLGDGSTVTDNVKRVQGIGAAVLVHSIADRVASVREALAAGAAGVIPKSSATKTVLQAAATVARGEVLNNLEWATAIDADRDFSKAQLGRREREILQAAATVARGEVLNNLEWATAIDADRDFSKAQLGRREREILHLYASGLPLKLAAEQLGIGYSTAREYLDRIRVKYVEVGRPAPTKVDLLRRAVEDGILPGLDPDGGDVS